MRLKNTTISAIIILVALATIIGLSGLSFIIPNVREVQPPQVNNRQYSEVQPPKINNMNKIFLTTKDGVKIAANLYEVNNPAGWVVFSHMMPATKESYRDLAQRLQNLGYESIAIDLRGHGESDGGPDGYRNFSDAEHQKSILDLEAATDYLAQNRGATAEKIAFIGASIGANLSLQYIAEHSEFSAEGGSASGGKTAILLSPGLNYRGIKTEPIVKNLKAGQKVLFVSAKDDGSNAEENQKLFDLTSADVEKKIQIYETGGHGTDILSSEGGSASGGETQPGLNGLIIEFLK